MFIPAGAGLIDAWDALRPICVQIVMIMVVSTIVVMIVSGHVTQFVMRRGKRKGEQQ
jgi:holin-like protein